MKFTVHATAAGARAATLSTGRDTIEARDRGVPASRRRLAIERQLAL